jgi:hypothetical protein
MGFKVGFQAGLPFWVPDEVLDADGGHLSMSVRLCHVAKGADKPAPRPRAEAARHFPTAFMTMVPDGIAILTFRSEWLKAEGAIRPMGLWIPSSTL